MVTKSEISIHHLPLTIHPLLSSAAAAGAAPASAAGAARAARAGPARAAALGAGLVDRVGLGAARHRRLRVEDFAAVDPALDADDAEGRVRLGEAVVRVRAQRVQGQ